MQQPTDSLLYSIGCAKSESCDYVRLNLDVSNAGELDLLVDSGADISLLKSKNLLGTVEFEPDERVRLKSVDGSVIETHGSLEVKVQEGQVEIPFKFQLVSTQVDIKGDGILGRDFLQRMRAKICYESRTLTLQSGGTSIKKRLCHVQAAQETGERAARTITLPQRAEIIVRLPVVTGTDVTEGLVERKELAPGVYMAGCIARVVDGHVLTSIVNTREEEVRLDSPNAEVKEIWDEDADFVMTRSNAEPKRDREQGVLEQLRLDHLNLEEGKSIQSLCFDYQDVFFLPGDRLSSTPTVKHAINLEPGTTPINTRPYRLPESQRQEIDEQVTKLLDEGIIERSDSPWNSPILVVPKKTGIDGKPKWRLVVDFRKLNEKTIGDAYPLPDITEILDQLGQSKYFSCLDMVMGYHQIELEESSRPKAAFSTKQGHWHYKRLPFGLKTAPATFQKLMNAVLSGLTGTRCFVYLDDIVIYAKSLAEHDVKIREVLDRLRAHGLKLQPEKCEFLRKEVSYLGHQITEAGVKPDPTKVGAIERFSTPTSTKQVKTFCGMISYYRRFIPNCSKIASPLYQLLKKDAKFEWTEAQEHAFQYLKSRLMSQPILQYPDYSKEFILTTDASNDGLGAVLSQGTVGVDLPIAYASRKLNKAEMHYTTSEKELLAIVWATKYFRPYLYGRRFTIVTDHQPLTWVMSVKDPGSRLLRWRIHLSEYDYNIVYKKGSLNTNADALSRIGSIIQESSARVEIDEERKKQILYEFHDAPTGGHRGMNKTYRAIKAKYTWPKMREEIEDYVKRCRSCQVNKLLKPRRKAPMEITSTAERPFEKCYLDIVGPLTESERGNKYILTCQDDLSRYVIAAPIPQQDAETVAREFVAHVVLKHGTPSTVQTDQGSNFLSEVFKNTCKLLRIKKIQSTAFHPESQGSLERSHRVLAEYLRHYIKDDQRNWDEWVHFAVYTYNTTEHSATGYSPFELLFGHPSILPSALKEDPSPQYTYDDYACELRGRLQTAHRLAKDSLMASKGRSKDHYDKNAEEKDFTVGDKVLLFDETVRRGRSKKLSAQWIGPYEIVGMDRVNATIKKGRRLIKVHVNRLKPFY